MPNITVNPTRMELTRLKGKLRTAQRGHKLLKDKRDELMRQFLELVRENKALRETVEAGIAAANKNFVLARAGMDDEVLNVAMMAPMQEVYLEASERNVMSVEIPVFEYKTRSGDENNIYSYGFAFTSSDLDGAIKSLSDILPDLLRCRANENGVYALYACYASGGAARCGIFAPLDATPGKNGVVALADGPQACALAARTNLEKLHLAVIEGEPNAPFLAEDYLHSYRYCGKLPLLG